LRKAVTIPILLLLCLSLRAQYYIRGEIKDEAGKPLANVKILIHSTGLLYRSGSSGGFGIPSNRATDSLSFSFDGYESRALRTSTSQFISITMKMLRASSSVQRARLLSVTKDLRREQQRKWALSGESYSAIVENDFINAQRYPSTGFAPNVDKASYSNIRRFLNIKSTAPPDAVRIEELLNYFNFEYHPPASGQLFNLETKVTSCPWNPDNQLLFVNMSARRVNIDTIPPSNLVFLIDVSGSMDLPNRLPLLKSAFRKLVNNLRSKDTVSIVVYGGTVGVMLPPTSGADKTKIMNAIEELTPGGATPGESGIRTAYRLAKSQYIKGGNNRVILATDGDFNVGQTTEKDLDELITSHRASDIYLTCLGVGMGNYKDSKLEILAKKGNGNFSYLDNEREAEKVLVKELTQTLYSIADDVFLEIQFDPRYVKDYRLLGFDNKANAIADSTSELEGGEIGSGHTLMAMFEIVPAADNVDAINHGAVNNIMAELVVHYYLPGDKSRKPFQLKHHCPLNYDEFKELPASYRFATSVAMFGMLLRESVHAKNISWDELLDIAKSAMNAQDALHIEFYDLLQSAKKIYMKEKKDRKRKRDKEE
jgi:Ca-activated chloride channel homolog